MFDGRLMDQTGLTISLSQRNLFPPSFEELEYTNDNPIEEGDNSASSSNPKFITTVSPSHMHIWSVEVVKCSLKACF